MPATPYLTADAAKERDQRLADFDASDIENGVADFEDKAEEYRGVAYTPRDAEATLRGNAASYLFLPHLKVRTVESITIDGTALSVSELADVTTWGDEGALERGVGWCGTQIVVAYTHGFEAPPATVLTACTEYVLCVLRAQKSGVSRNTLSEATEAGTTRYSTPDWNAGRPTGWLEVDRLLNSLPDYRTPGMA